MIDLILLVAELELVGLLHCQMNSFNTRISRYAPATQLWKGRLHVMGGSKENRHTPGLDHWSLAVKDGKALEKQWRTEIPIPRGGPHRSAYFPDSCSRHLLLCNLQPSH